MKKTDLFSALSEIVRGGWLPGESGADKKQNQTCATTYDSFSNTKTITVGGRTLLTNQFGSKNGQLQKQTYGNGASVTYTYDNLGRTTKTAYSNGRTLDYTYTGDGQLNTVKDSASGIRYTYLYDTIGRLIGSRQSGTNIRTQYTYDADNRLTRWDYAAPSLSTVYETYTYNKSTTDSISDGALTAMRMLTGDSATFGYDSLSRLKTRTVAGKILEAYSYVPGKSTGTTTTLVSEKKNQVNGIVTQTLQYAYHPSGNIASVTDTRNNTSVSYAYDKQGQLTSAIHKTGSTTKRTEAYTYDTYGNIRSFNNGTTSHSYTYGDANWKDLLTAVDGHAITYDGSGNPLSYYNGKSYTMTWSEGRRLASIKTGGNTTTYTYDLNGLRTKKVNPDGTWVKYFIADGKILGETLYRANNTEVYDMRYTFDENGEVCGISLWTDDAVGWVKYYFVKNLQGDVLAVYQYGDTFTKVAEYTYDSWGNVLTATGTLAATNPFRYRSYYQDTETGFYYLQSRYYDPSIGRFLNADIYASTGQGFIGYNIFAYCLNNSVNYVDRDGENAEALQWWTTAAGWLPGADAVLPIGDIIYLGGIVLLGAIALATSSNDVPEISYAVANAAYGSSPPNNNNDDDDYDEYYDDENNFGGRQKVGKSKGNAPGNNQAQNRQFRDATKGLTPEQQRIVHDKITGKGLGFHEIKAVIEELFTIVIGIITLAVGE